MKLETLNFVFGRRALRGLTCAARKLAYDEIQRGCRTSLGDAHG